MDNENVAYLTNRKAPKYLEYILAFFVLSLTIYSTLVLLDSINDGFNTSFPGGDWAPIFFLVQVPFYLVIWHNIRMNRKYFIKWDDNLLAFNLPGTDAIRMIDIDEIENINSDHKEIAIKLKTGETETYTISHLALTYVEISAIRSIINKQGH